MCLSAHGGPEWLCSGRPAQQLRPTVAQALRTLDLGTAMRASSRAKSGSLTPPPRTRACPPSRGPATACDPDRQLPRVLGPRRARSLRALRLAYGRRCASQLAPAGTPPERLRPYPCLASSRSRGVPRVCLPPSVPNLPGPTGPEVAPSGSKKSCSGSSRLTSRSPADRSSLTVLKIPVSGVQFSPCPPFFRVVRQQDFRGEWSGVPTGVPNHAHSRAGPHFHQDRIGDRCHAI
jgi:hypothetical protein